MRKIKTLLCLMLVFLIIFVSTGCSSGTSPEQTNAPESDVNTEPQPSDESDKSEDATIKFTDSAGREVEIPANLERIAPSGPLAQVVLYTLCPDKLVGLASDLSDLQFEYIDLKYKSLPVFGNFYADTLNLEAVMAAKPQVVIDIGEAKPTVKEDMQGVQDKIGIPSLFVHMELDKMAEAYRTLGKIVGEEEQAEKLAAYVEKTLAEAKENSASIPDADRVKVYYGQGDAGLTAVVKGTVHSDVIDTVGALNVADVEQSVRGGASDISMEQLMLWQPDAIMFAPGSIYSDVETRPEWKEINAVKNKKCYEIPDGPYNWVGRPPSVNRVIGIKWLGNLLYPDVYDYDMKTETKEFYKLFYHCDVTDEQIDKLLTNSTFKN